MQFYSNCHSWSETFIIIRFHVQVLSLMVQYYVFSSHISCILTFMPAINRFISFAQLVQPATGAYLALTLHPGSSRLAHAAFTCHSTHIDHTRFLCLIPDSRACRGPQDLSKPTITTRRNDSMLGS